jgi:hypothetical protein
VVDKQNNTELEKNQEKNVTVAMIRCIVSNMEWQWQGGSGVSRFVRSMRFEWYKLESGSGSIHRDMIVSTKTSKKYTKKCQQQCQGTPHCPQSGSGWMTLVPFESPHQAASNETTANQPLPTPTNLQPIKHNTHTTKTHTEKKNNASAKEHRVAPKMAVATRQ